MTKDAILKIFYEEIVPQAAKGKIEIDAESNNNLDIISLSICFNTKIVNENKEFYENDEVPPLLIKSKEKFDEYLYNYINIFNSYLNDLNDEKIDRLYPENSRENYKYLLALTFFNASPMDFNDPVEYLKKRTNFILDKTFEKYRDYETICNVEEWNSIIECKMINNYPSLETPHSLSFRINSNGNIFELPKVVYGISDNIAYIYAVQNKKRKDLDVYQKKINRSLYTFNKGIIDSEEYYKYKNSDYYPENISDVSMSSLLSITLLIKLLQENNITKITVVPYLPLRYFEKVISAERFLGLLESSYGKEKVEAKKKELNIKRDFNQNNMTDKMIRSFRRVIYQLNNGKIIMPYEVSDSMHIEILDNLKFDDNLLNKIYFDTFDTKNDARKK